MRSVLIANRGEIAVRVIRACRDEGIRSIAVYADPDRDAQHVVLADEAYALDGATPAETYLSIDKLVAVAQRAGAEGVHPGYGFLSENAAFAQAVIDAGLIWIGPPPAAIDALGDKVKARHLAAQAGAPLTPGTPDPVAGVEEVLAFADEHGLPVAIKAAYGGGGRGLKVARTREEIPELFDSAVREAVAAFGRGECFVERYLDRPRHVETQVLADSHGNVAVVGTRDCSLQRRHQKVVEEAPAPWLTDAQRAELVRASKEICKAAGYVNAGTCEFLVAVDGSLSFLEVNTRLQVEHPVTEETSGVDLVRAQFAVARGASLADIGLATDPEPRGHAIEFRLNAEDAGRGFLPAPGTISRWVPPSGPGVRLDAGYVAGDTVPGAFDSLIGKLVVSGATRRQAVERARRALAEMVIDGMPTLLPFHRAVLDDPAFVPEDDEPFSVYTRWIETDWAGGIPPYDGAVTDGDAPGERQRVVVEVAGRRLEVTLPADLAPAASARTTRAAAPARRAGGKAVTVSGDTLTAPMQGTIVKVGVAEGDTVAAGDLVVVLEAMKMEQPITAHKAGTVTDLAATVGASVQTGTALCRIVDQP